MRVLGLVLVALCLSDAFNLTLVTPGKLRDRWLPLNRYSGDCTESYLNEGNAYKCVGGAARFAGFLSHVRNRTDGDVLTLVPGDFLTGSTFFHYYGGSIPAKYFSLLGVSATSLGYRERGNDDPSVFFEEWPGPIIVSNRPEAPWEHIAERTEAMHVFDMDGRKVAVIALSNRPFEPADQLVEAVQNQCAVAIDAGVKHIVLISSLLSAAAIETVIKSSVGIDAVVTELSPQQLAAALDLDIPDSDVERTPPLFMMGPGNRKVPILPAQYDFRTVAAVDLVFDERGVVLHFHHEYAYLSDKWDTFGDPLYDVVREEVFTDHAIMTAAFSSAVVGTIPTTFRGTRTVCRFMDCEVGMLTCDACRWRTNTQIAFWNGGGFNGDIPAGDVTIDNILGVSSFQDYLVPFSITGEKLVLMVEHGLRLAEHAGCVERDDCPSGTGSFLQVSGVRFSYVPGHDAGHRLVDMSVEVEPGTWRPVDLDATYTATTNNYLAAGGSGFGEFIGDIDLDPDPDLGQVRFQDLLIEYLSEFSPLGTPDGPRVLITSRTPPLAVAIDPTEGSAGGGFPVSVTGKSFVGDEVRVMLGDVPCKDVNVVNDTLLTCTAGVMVHLGGSHVRALASSYSEGTSIPSLGTLSLVPGCPEFAISVLDECLCRAGYTAKDDQCVPCVAGTFSATDGSLCEECPAGSFAVEGAAMCQFCPDGTVAPNAGSSECTACQEHSQSAADRQRCLCNPGMYAPTGKNDVCEPCPKGGLCPDLGTTVENMHSMEGYWRANTTSTDYYECLEGCKGGAGPHNCDALRKGRLCAACVEGASSCAGHCKPCEGVSFWISFIFIVGAVLMSCFLLMPSWPHPITANVQMAIDFYQLAYLLMPPDAPLLSLVRLVSFGLAEFEELQGFPCFSCLTPLQDVMAPSFVPMLLIAVLSIVAAVWCLMSLAVDASRYRGKVKFMVDPETVVKVEKEQANAIVQALEIVERELPIAQARQKQNHQRYMLQVQTYDFVEKLQKKKTLTDKRDRRGKVMKECLQRFNHAALRIITLTWAVTCQTLLNIVNCYTVDNTMVLRAHPAVECYQSLHIAAAVYAFVGIALYLVVIPAVYWRHQRSHFVRSLASDVQETASRVREMFMSRSSQDFEESLSQLVPTARFHVYKNGFEGYNALILCRRSLFVFMAVLTAPVLAVQVTCLTLFILLSSFIHYYLAPYYRVRDNITHFVFLQILVVLTSLKAINWGENDRSVYLGLTVVFTVVPVTLVTGMMANHFWGLRHENKVKKAETAEEEVVDYGEIIGLEDVEVLGNTMVSVLSGWSAEHERAEEILDGSTTSHNSYVSVDRAVSDRDAFSNSLPLGASRRALV